jgi:filamentous hemagglutinin family protein
MNNRNISYWRSWGLKIISIFSAITVFSPVSAQIKPDQSLGDQNSVITPNVMIKNELADQINGGVTRNNLLFHSFEQFNVHQGQRVYFQNPSGIDNILTRVTGNNLSNINGLLGVHGNANLYLINPQGIIFGNQAKLDINGSFFASTTSSIKIGNQWEFTTTNPQVPPLLTINVPLGLQLGKVSNNNIINQGNLQGGKNLKFTANNIEITGGLTTETGDLNLQANDTIKIQDNQTNPLIIKAGKNLTLQGNNSLDVFLLNHPDSGLYSGQDLVLRSDNQIGGDAHFYSGGNLRIEKLDHSLGGLFSPHDPVLTVSGDVSFNNYQGSSLHIFAGGSVNIPNSIYITGTDTLPNVIKENVTLSDGKTVINIDGNNQKTLDIRAGTTALNNNISNTGNPTGSGINIGKIYNFSDSLIYLTNQYQPNLNLPSENIQVNYINGATANGNSANIIIDSRADINLITISNYSNNGHGGNINLLAQNNINMNDGLIDGRSKNNGHGGNINLLAQNNININNAIMTVSAVGNYGNSGNINITSKNGELNLVDSEVKSNIYGIGKQGEINFNVPNITIDNSSITTLVFGQLDPNSMGRININSNSLIVKNYSELNSSVVYGAIGTGSDINIKAKDSVIFDGGFALSRLEKGGTGKAGNIIIDTGSLKLTGIPQDVADANVGQIVSSTFGNGDAGNVIITAKKDVIIDGRGSDIWSFVALDQGIGNGGIISIDADKISILNSARVLSILEYQGTGGTIHLTAKSSINIDGNNTIVETSTQPEASGNAGKVIIKTPVLNLTNGGFIKSHTVTNTFGNAGDIEINADKLVNISGKNTGIEISTNTLGNGGIIKINTPILQVKDQAILDAQTKGSGDGGDIVINAKQIDILSGAKLQGTTSGSGKAGEIIIQENQQLNIDGIGSNLITSSLENSTGLAGDIHIDTQNLNITNGGEINSSTSGTGKAGNIEITAQKTVNIQGKNTQLATSSNSSGTGGNIDIKTQEFSLLDQALLNAEATSIGNGGNIYINSDLFTMKNGAQIQGSTSNSGNAGNIEIVAKQKFILDGENSGIFAANTADSTGKSGNIKIDPPLMIISNGAEISVESKGQGLGGSLEISADQLFLQNNAVLSAATTSADGGNIKLNISDFLFTQNNSMISAKAGGTGNGGNIEISTPYLLSINTENNDIIANAFKGKGGNINITANGIFGIQNSANLTPDSDINASSEFGTNGVVEINTPGIDPAKGLTSLPAQIVDVNSLTKQTCGSGTRVSFTKNQFKMIGRGGLPRTPNKPFDGDELITDFANLPHFKSAKIFPVTPNNINTSVMPLREAQGIIIQGENKINLIADRGKVIPFANWFVYRGCN